MASVLAKLRFCSREIGNRIDPEPVEHIAHIGVKVLETADKVHDRFSIAKPDSATGVLSKDVRISNEIRESAVFEGVIYSASEEIRGNQFFVWISLETELEVGIQKLRVLITFPKRSHYIVVTLMRMIV